MGWEGSGELGGKIIRAANAVHARLGPGLLESAYELSESGHNVELKAAESILPIHVAQAITYLRLTGKPVCLILNFNVREHEPRGHPAHRAASGRPSERGRRWD